MIVFVEDENTNTMLTKIYIDRQEETGNYEYLISDKVGGLTSEGVIYNHTGNHLELLEKILHGRNLS